MYISDKSEVEVDPMISKELRARLICGSKVSGGDSCLSDQSSGSYGGLIYPPDRSSLLIDRYNEWYPVSCAVHIADKS